VLTANDETMPSLRSSVEARRAKTTQRPCQSPKVYGTGSHTKRRPEAARAVRKASGVLMRVAGERGLVILSLVAPKIVKYSQIITVVGFLM